MCIKAFEKLEELRTSFSPLYSLSLNWIYCFNHSFRIIIIRVRLRLSTGDWKGFYAEKENASFLHLISDLFITLFLASFFADFVRFLKNFLIIDKH